MEKNIQALNEDKIVLNNFLQKSLHTLPEKKHGYGFTGEAIELIIRPECNQKCEYCYITQHGKELYPQRLNKEDTLHNVDLFLDYILNNLKIFPHRWELFAGDLFYDDIFFDIIELFKKHLIPIFNNYQDLFVGSTNFYNDIVIIVPSNLSFVYYQPEKAKKTIELIDDLYKTYNIKIAFSWSTDGPYAIDSREKKNLPDNYFDTIIDFCIKTQTGYHPMLAAENIEHWKENYDWWLEACEKLNKGTNHIGDFQPYLLDVRNDNWTDDKIDAYLELLDHMMKIRFEKICKSDVDILSRHFFQNDTLPPEYSRHGCDPLHLNYKNPDTVGYRESPSCSLFSGLHFNCTNLSLVPCHRLSYANLTTCYFITDENNEHIIDFVPQNTSLFLSMKTMKFYNAPICAQCKLMPICLLGCHGAQFEYSGDPYLPIPSLCYFFHRKYAHLIKLYEKYNLIEHSYKNQYIDDEIYNYYKNLLTKIKEEEENGQKIFSFKYD